MKQQLKFKFYWCCCFVLKRRPIAKERPELYIKKGNRGLTRQSSKPEQLPWRCLNSIQHRPKAGRFLYHHDLIEQ